MSRIHDSIVGVVTVSFVVGIVCLAEITKDRPAQKETAPVMDDSHGGFSLATVLIEQEVKSLAKNNFKDKDHETLVRSQVARFSPRDIKVLKKKSQDPAAKPEERQASLYLLSMAGDSAIQVASVPAVQKPQVKVAAAPVVTKSVAKAPAVKAPAAKVAQQKNVKQAKGRVPASVHKQAQHLPEKSKKKILLSSNR